MPFHQFRLARVYVLPQSNKFNVTVHGAAANDVDFRTRAARGSVCNGLLPGFFQAACGTYHLQSNLRDLSSDI